MRVISGIYRSRQLKTVPSRVTRPTSDRNKENMFNLLSPYLATGIVLDLFAGSGGLGIEALSRGYKALYSVDKQYEAIKVLKENKQALGLETMQIIKRDYLKALDIFAQKNIKFDLVILDPPYGKGMSLKALTILKKKNLLSDGAVVVVEENQLIEFKELILLKTKKYGITNLMIFTYKE